MTPKKKAEELYNNYIKILGITDLKVGSNFYVQQCALTAVDEILKSSPTTIGQMTGIKSNKKYWQKVKQELELL
jgi:ATP sulfurylase